MITIFTEKVTRVVFVELYTKSVVYIKNVKNAGKNEKGDSLIVATETGTYLFPLRDIRNWWIQSTVMNVKTTEA